MPGVPNQGPHPCAGLSTPRATWPGTMLEWRAMSLPPPGQPTIKVENPSDGGFWYWLGKFYAFGAVCTR